jgi:TorA maturation chaperone TorD
MAIPLTIYILEGMMLMWDIEFTDQFERDRWKAFYAEMIPLADDLFDEHLKDIETEGGI